MRRSFLVLASFTTLACAPRAADNATDSAVRQMGSANDVAAVQRAIDSSLVRFRDAIIRGDTATMASIYADDVMILSPNAKMARGHAEMNQMNAAMFSAFSVPAMKFTTLDLIGTGDYAIETGTYEMTMQPKKGKAMNDVGKYVSVWKKQADGSWKMIRDAFNSDKPAM